MSWLEKIDTFLLLQVRRVGSLWVRLTRTSTDLLTFLLLLAACVSLFSSAIKSAHLLGAVVTSITALGRCQECLDLFKSRSERWCFRWSEWPVGRLIWVALFLASLADFWHYHKEDDVLFSLGLLFTMVAGYVANLKIEAPPKMVTSRVSFQGV